MKSLTTVGILLLAVAILLFYLTTDFKIELSHFIGVMGGVGIGLIIGGVIGYLSKGSAVREAAKRKEFERLQKEKIEIEKQAAELAAQQNAYNKNTQD
ncbi:hypothetical protein [Riemerella anatipestifer]|uniref:DUF1049 domain-containing protein n=1 Tax=Riemerella anatipestifer RA-CH-1 TaxID=1228997 RepID=J9R7Y4_RIEAN|nr:hypothetical protein [Riemerella anatipestifer]AFR35837.1 hypothetical protein B739_1239 [Riemerella anatipestifer RA-CH-1]AIH02888.1 hypothetical protein M949_1721 [Riemerella anatipestifer CH3]MCO7331037.1 hypothetical protein [Riemerella anatipestifer]MCO7349913.1 hypothetical protein [Riemerella anatipestifer]MCU7581652.1 hypothetical protein [Riemerella anatipestifer]